MNYRYFSVKVTILVISIVAVFWLFVLLISRQTMVVTSIATFALGMALLFYLLRYVTKTNREIIRFLNVFKYNDSAAYFDEKATGGSFRELRDTFNIIITAFRKAKIEKEKEHRFFQATLENVGVGVIAFNNENKVLAYSKEAARMTGLTHLRELDNLNRLKTGLADDLKLLANGQQRLIKIELQGQAQNILQLAFSAVELKLENETVKLITFQDIKAEIDQSEMEGWQKLIRVLRHEIMNSVSPINILSTSLINMFKPDGKQIDKHQIDNDAIDNLLLALNAIKKRSKALARFVDNYRNVTNIPTPKFVEIEINKLIYDILPLFENEFKQKNITSKVHIDRECMTIAADEKLIEQVIINLLKNAIEATADTTNPQININAYEKNQHTNIEISDNGKGISTDIIEHIFIPFFTTKKQGSGIGLSLSKQIMRLHKGDILVVSLPQKTIFTLVF